MSPPKRCVSSPSVIALSDAIRYRSRSIRTTSWIGRQARLIRGQRLQHLIGDIDARTHVHRLLHDQVVMLRLGNLLDHLVCLIQHGSKFFIATLVQVFAKFALFALEVLVELRQIALLGGAVGRRHGGAVLVHCVRHGLQARCHVLQRLSRFENSCSSFVCAALAAADSRKMRSELTAAIRVSCASALAAPIRPSVTDITSANATCFESLPVRKVFLTLLIYTTD